MAHVVHSGRGPNAVTYLDFVEIATRNLNRAIKNGRVFRFRRLRRARLCHNCETRMPKNTAVVEWGTEDYLDRRKWMPVCISCYDEALLLED